MHDVTSYRSLWFYLWTLATAKHYGCPVIMYGCGIGPIRNNGNRARAARVMNRSVDSITLRDPDSLKELEVLGVTEPKIALSADTTVSLPPASPDIIDGILDSRGIPANGNYIGFILRPWPGFEEKTLPLPQIMSMKPTASRQCSFPSSLAWMWRPPSG